MSLWEELSPPWRAVVEEAWAGFCTGSWPTGAVIVDGSTDRIVARAHNLVSDPTASHPFAGSDVAHAELMALGQIKARVAGKPWILYCSLEPCPMCIGAIRMAHIGDLRFAARDRFAGALPFLTATRFMKSYPVKVSGPPWPALEDAILALAVARAAAMSKGGRWAKNVRHIGGASPVGLKLGLALGAAGVFAGLRKQKAGAQDMLAAIEEQRAKALAE